MLSEEDETLPDHIRVLDRDLILLPERKALTISANLETMAAPNSDMLGWPVWSSELSAVTKTVTARCRLCHYPIASFYTAVHLAQGHHV